MRSSKAAARGRVSAHEKGAQPCPGLSAEAHLNRCMVRFLRSGVKRNTDRRAVGRLHASVGAEAPHTWRACRAETPGELHASRPTRNADREAGRRRNGRSPYRKGITARRTQGERRTTGDKKNRPGRNDRRSDRWQWQRNGGQGATGGLPRGAASGAEREPQLTDDAVSERMASR